MPSFSLSGEPQASLWFMEEGPLFEIALSSRVRLARNISGYTFPAGLSEEGAEDVSRLIRRAMKEASLPWEGGSFREEDFSPVLRRLLLERSLVSQDFLRRRSGELYYREDQQITLQINYRDHLHITAMKSGLDLQGAWQEVDALDSLFERELPFSHSLEFGYLTEDITGAGTGLRASVMVHLPAISRNTTLLNRAFESVTQLGFSVRGYSGGAGTSGEMYIIANEVTIGVSEEEILQSLERVVKHLDSYERKIREDALVSHRTHWEQRVFTGWTRLTEERSLSQEEALEHLSAVRLGVLLGWLDYLSLKDVTMLFTFVQKGHILSMRKEREGENEARARIIREILHTSP